MNYELAQVEACSACGTELITWNDFESETQQLEDCFNCGTACDGCRIIATFVWTI